MPSVVIVGAGISGLSLAYRLQQRIPDLKITVLERRDRPGGTMWTERRDGFQVEIGPNGFLDNKSSTLDLCRDLGLGDRLLAASEAAGRNRYLVLDGSVWKGLARTACERRAEAAAQGEVPYQPGAPATASQRAGQMWSFGEGLRLPVETLCQRLPHPPVLGVTIQRIAREPSSQSGWR